MGNIIKEDLGEGDLEGEANRLFTKLLREQTWAERAQLIDEAPPEVTAFLPYLAAARRRNITQLERLLYAIRPSQERDGNDLYRQAEIELQETDERQF